MADAKASPAAQNEAAEIEAEMLQAMADAKGGRYAKMAQRSKVMKNIESKPAAQIEDAEIEAEMLQAMADAKASPEVSTRQDGGYAKMAQRSKVMKNIESKPAALNENEAAEIE